MKFRFITNLAIFSLFFMISAICYADSPLISNAVIASDVSGDTLTPEGVSKTFPPNVKILHAVVTLNNAPENTKVKAVWLTSQGQSMGEFELSSGGNINLDFTFEPTAGLPTGDYSVNLFVNGKFDRTLRFNIADQPTTGNATKGHYIDSITMALGTTGEEKEPENITSVFSPTNTFHAVVRTNNAPANTRFKASWYLVKSESGGFAPNTFIDSTEISTEGTRFIDFTLKPTTQMPAGTYRVEFHVNGVLDPLSATFTVKE